MPQINADEEIQSANDRQHSFTPLIDAKAAGRLLGVPHTWLLTQARTGRIPHYRLGHYVRFNREDLEQWLQDTRLGPRAPEQTADR